MATATCTHDGTETRLKCVTCETSICPKCLVETKVGFKCPEHGRVTAAPLPKTPKASKATKPADGDADSDGKAGRSSRPRGRMRIWPIFLVVLLFPAFGLLMMVLFAVTAESDGIIRLLPLIAIGAAMFGGAFYFASKVSR